MEFGTPLPRPVWLYVFKQDGCFACEEAEHHLRRLKSTYPLKVMIVERYLNRGEWNGLGWVPASTPGYALVDRNGPEQRLVKKKVGLMEFDDLVAWMDDYLL